MRPPDAAERAGLKRAVGLVDAIIVAVDPTVTEKRMQVMERRAFPTCGPRSGTFRVNSMNGLTNARGLPSRDPP